MAMSGAQSKPITEKIEFKPNSVNVNGTEMTRDQYEGYRATQSPNTGGSIPTNMLNQVTSVRQSNIDAINKIQERQAVIEAFKKQRENAGTLEAFKQELITKENAKLSIQPTPLGQMGSPTVTQGVPQVTGTPEVSPSVKPNPLFNTRGESLRRGLENPISETTAELGMVKEDLIKAGNKVINKGYAILDFYQSITHGGKTIKQQDFERTLEKTEADIKEDWQYVQMRVMTPEEMRRKIQAFEDINEQMEAYILKEGGQSMQYRTTEGLGIKQLIESNKVNIAKYKNRLDLMEQTQQQENILNNYYGT